ncbi:DUF7350 domain-containing protein [Salarchaeum japonicum]|uniref:Iron transporter n=1 Tax=Salarchaeum japonicum TaxID=555573 RepID=A0AAV3T2D3_9EURY|nr:hypothetical protein [Salarchaeum japonicum]
MNRRRFLAAAGVSGTVGLAGCLDALGFGRQSSPYAPPLVEDRPDAVYYPTHVEGMKSFGTATDGPYKCALTYSYPHRFWLLTSNPDDPTNKVGIRSEDSMHVMPVVWHEETGVVPPAANPSVEFALADGDESVPSVSPWPMLSQPMGVHFGDNVALPRNGDYTATVRVAFGSTKRTGALADAPDAAEFAFEFTYLAERVDTIAYRTLDDAGERGAVEPMQMDVPVNQLAPPAELPGSLVGTGTSGDADVAVVVADDAARFGGRESERYLAVSPRTPYNRFPLPLASVSATATTGGETVHDGPLTATLDPELGYHYGAPVADAPDEVAVSFDAPPQVARHEGYETAFLDMPTVSV